MTTVLPTLLKALRQASTPSEISTAVDKAVDRLISTSSLVESQKLVSGACAVLVLQHTLFL